MAVGSTRRVPVPGPAWLRHTLVPGAWLMRLLPVWGKVALLIAVLAGPLVGSALQAAGAARADEALTRQERQGLRTVVALDHLMIAVARCTDASLEGRDYRELPKALRAASQALASSDRAGVPIPHAEPLLRSIRLAAAVPGPACIDTARVRPQLTSLVHLVREVADVSHLTLDPEQRSHYEGSLLTDHLPRVVAGLVEVKILLAGGSSSVPSDERFEVVRVAVVAAEAAARAHRAMRLSTAADHARGDAGRLARTGRLTQWASEQVDLTHRVVDAQGDAATTAQVTVGDPDAGLAEVDGLTSSVGRQLDGLFAARQVEQHIAWQHPAAGTATAFSVVLYLLLALGWSMSRDLDAVRSGLSEAVSGSTSAVRLGGRDELGLVARSVSEAQVQIASLMLELRRTADQLRYRAFHDDLTGLANRALFLDRLTRALAGAPRSGRSLAVCVMDLDGFKAINDRLGHGAGDEVLRTVAQRFAAVVRPGDTLARLGGDEFGVLLEDVDEDVARAVIQRMIDCLVSPSSEAESASQKVPALAGHDQPGPVSVSAGFAVVHGGRSTADQLMNQADLAMYDAKVAGSAVARAFSPEMTRPDRRAACAEVRDLLADPDGIIMVFQPICDLRGGRVVGYEALARFPGREHRRVDEWFQLARECGCGADLESAALRAALAAPGRPRGSYLSVNVSPRTLLSAQIKAVLDRDLTEVVVEVTEDSQLDADLVGTAVGPLRARGARIAVDDTGAGYANLKALVRLRPDIVKLDREMVTAVHRHPEKRALVEALVSFCRRTGAMLCAEGIEEVEELVTLAELGVHLGQGWFLGRPAPDFLDASQEAVAACGGGHDDGGRTALVPVLALLAASPQVSDVAGALMSLHWLMGVDDVTLSLVKDGGLFVVSQDGLSVSERVYQLADYPLTAEALAADLVAEVRTDDPDADEQEVRLLREMGFRSLLIVPVVADGQPLAIIELSTSQPRSWSEAALTQVREIAAATAVALAHVDLGRVPLGAAH